MNNTKIFQLNCITILLMILILLQIIFQKILKLIGIYFMNKLKHTIHYFLRRLFKRNSYKLLCNSESDLAHWEILTNSETDTDTVTLYYIPEDHYSENDVKIEVSNIEFEDLIKFIKKL